jgi:hypothetical protein
VTWLDVLGWAGSALLVWSLLQARLLRLRALNFVGCLVLIAYNAALRVWPMVGLNVVLAVINLWYLAGMLRTRHDQRRYQVVRVGTDDDFLEYVLATHAADIERYNPGFRWQRGPDRSAYLVLSGDDLVGVMLIRAVDETTAQVELDYVTRRFRDLTPGEFVYQRSSLFTDRGFRRILTPPGMVRPYYDRLGFRQAGDSYVLEW